MALSVQGCFGLLPPPSTSQNRRVCAFAATFWLSKRHSNDHPPVSPWGLCVPNKQQGERCPSAQNTTAGGAWNGPVYPGSGVSACACLQSSSDTRGGTRTWVEGLFGSLWLRGSLLFCVSGSVGSSRAGLLSHGGILGKER